MKIYIDEGQHLNKADYIFTRTITDDEIFLQKCISIDKELKDALFDNGSIEDGMNFINFIQTYYTNDEIIGIWNSIERIDPSIIKDGMKSFRSINERVLFNNFEKVENNFIDLSEEFANLRIIEKEWLKNNVSLYYPNYPINNTYYTLG